MISALLWRMRLLVFCQLELALIAKAFKAVLDRFVHSRAEPRLVRITLAHS